MGPLSTPRNYIELANEINQKSNNRKENKFQFSDNPIDYINAAGTAIGLMSDWHNTANDYTENTFNAQAVKVPTSNQGLSWLSSQSPMPVRSGEDFGYQNIFANGGCMCHKKADGGWGIDVLNGGATGAAIGTMIMPGIGTAIGAGLGALGSGIANGIRNSRANREAELYNEERRREEANRAYALGLGASQIGRERNAAFDRSFIYADGGRIPSVMEGGNGVSEIKNGGRHESNPLGGVPIGIASDGLPNLVEEGEVKWNDYIFSNRLRPNKRIMKDNVLTDKKWEGKTYAEIAKAIQKDSKERPNDPTERQTTDEMLERLKNAQETTRMEKEIKEIQKMIANMSPEEMARLLQGMQGIAPMQQPVPMQQYAGMPQELSQGAAMPQEANIVPAEESVQPMAEEPTMMAYGGHLFEPGGDLTKGTWTNPTYSSWYGSTDPIWIELTEKAEKENIDLSKKSRKELAALIRETEAYKRGTEWLKASPENMEMYLKEVIKQKSPQQAINYANRFFDKSGHLKKDLSYDNIFKAVREDEYPGTYWHTFTEAMENYIKGTEPKQEQPIAVSSPNTGIRYYIKDGDKYTFIGPQEQYDEWVLDNAQYGKPILFRDNIKEGDTTYTDYFVQLPEEIKGQTPFPRYSPWQGIANAGLAFSGAFNMPDYEKANIIEQFQPKPTDYTPIGNYISYNPLDADYMANIQRSQNAATRAAIANMANPSRNAALLSADFNGTVGLGTAYEQARQYNDKERQNVANYNRETDKFNAAAANQVALTNFGLNNLDWEKTKAFADARDAATSTASAANSAAVTAAMNNLGEGYQSWYNNKALQWMIENGIYKGVDINNATMPWSSNKASSNKKSTKRATNE